MILLGVAVVMGALAALWFGITRRRSASHDSN
jgi:hypothetical protein